MYFFSIEKLEQYTGNEFINIFQDYYNVSKLKRLPKFKYPDMRGTSWILYPEPLFDKNIADIAYVIQYIKLAARRDYFLYKQYNYIGLNITYYPNLNLHSISNNPLLHITEEDNINFKFEEIYLRKINNGKKIR